MKKDYFLDELNAITNYANSSNTAHTETIVREMLSKLLNMSFEELTNYEFETPEPIVKEYDKNVR